MNQLLEGRRAFPRWWFLPRVRRSTHEVRPVSHMVGVALIAEHHYAGGAPNTATYCHGLFRKGDLFDSQAIGVALWIPPTKGAAQATYPERWQGVLSLSRLVILPDAPVNAATFLLAGSRRLIDRNAWPCLVTYADTWRGHTGGIYRADNWEYMGLTKPERVYTLNGRMMARKAGARTRTHAEMLALGCVCEGSFRRHKYRRVK